VAVSIDDVKKIATLSKLRYDDAELDSFVPQFQGILDYFAQLSSVPTDDVKPTYHALEGVSGTPFRSDQAQASLSAEAAVANAPEQSDCQFRVPKVIE
jgi:aspartyl-tRNA(Asn)/glutamyl-tRNA(Gln) amidotransferase subunit C